MADAHSRPRPKHFRDLTGQRFGRLTATRFLGKIDKKSRWQCVCDCGTECVKAAQHLVLGMIRSCGCLRIETSREQLRATATKHGASRGPTSLQHSRWAGMMDRCYNTANHAYARYGGRGITVCDRWHDVWNFIADMGEPPERLLLERIDNDGPYSPENCRWASYSEQNNNRRSTRKVTRSGETKSIAQWARSAGLSKSIVYDRLRRGWSMEMALTSPPTPPGQYVIRDR